MTTFEKLLANRDNIIKLVEGFGATNLRVFGSVAENKDSAGSDVDFLVDWEKEHSLFDRIELKYKLEEMLGRKVDICIAKNLHWYIKDNVIKNAKPV